ncbi:MAG TPA: EAL domain-containing protein, partial [Coriobacteriia bacterium]|nr:EAL domain-containing protein [Coriobacteriia bacterium]
VSLALDDFGTGYSSLERLGGLPISVLKIDRSFVSDLCSETDGHPIIDTILVLARKLGLRVVAEGVERACHLDYLKSEGCAEVQGYLFARPCGFDEVSAHITGVDDSVPAGAGPLCDTDGPCKLRRLLREKGAPPPANQSEVELALASMGLSRITDRRAGRLAE